MKLIERIKSLFKRKSPIVQSSDDFEREVILRAWNTGKIVIGNVDEKMPLDHQRNPAMTSTNNPLAIREAVEKAVMAPADDSKSLGLYLPYTLAELQDRILSAIAPLLAPTPPVSTSAEKCAREIKELEKAHRFKDGPTVAQYAAILARHFNGQGEDSGPMKNYEGSSGISCKQRPYTREELSEYLRLYMELIYSVASVWPGESRHETALRYIRERESRSGSAGSAMSAQTQG